jgi:hypothetical protein
LDEAAKGSAKRAFYYTSKGPTALMMMEIQRQSQDEGDSMSNCTMEGLEVWLSRIEPQFPEEMFIPQEHQDPPLGLNFGP